MQHVWAVLRTQGNGSAVRAWFIDDTLNVFDYIDFGDETRAIRGLEVNGFEPFDAERHGFIQSPVPWAASARFRWRERRIYSNGQFWVQP